MPRAGFRAPLAWTVVALFAVPSLVFAQSRPDAEIGLFVGMSHADEDLVGGGEGRDWSPLVGVRFASRLNPDWNWFLDANYMQHETVLNDESKVFEGRTGFERLFPIGGGDVNWFLSGALGAADVNYPSGLDDFARPLFSLGIGLAKDRGGLRGEVRAETLVGNEGLDGANVTNVQILVGYTFGLFEKGARPAERPVFEPGQRKLVLEGVNFEFDSARLTRDSYAVLDRTANSLRAWPNVRVEIGGHTDEMGTPEYNLELSQRRAEAVRSYLMSKGISGSRLTARGYGETEPVAPNRTEEGRAKNRRVELKQLGD